MADGGGQVLDCRIRLSERVEQHTQAEMRLGILGRKANGFLELLKRAFGVAGKRKRGSELMTQSRIIRRQFHCRLEVRHGGREIAGAQCPCATGFLRVRTLQ